MESNFSKEEIKDLSLYIENAINEYSTEDYSRVLNLCEFYNYDYKQMISDSPMLLCLLEVSFENIPLRINDSIDIDHMLAL